MPELPEVQFAADTFRRHLGGATLSGAVISQPSVVRPHATAYRRALKNRRITNVQRYGKHILVGLEPDTDSSCLTIHLGMTGKLVWTTSSPTHKHLCVRWQTTSGALCFVDMRRFGRTMVGPEEEVRKAVGIDRLGIDALQLENGLHLRTCLANTNKPIKSALLDQHRVAGLGNIQACEALFRAALSPWKRTGSLTSEEFETLHRAIRTSLLDTLKDLENSAKSGGPTYLGDGLATNPFQVYLKAGEDCPSCGTTIERAALSGRGTYFCRQCQGVL